MTSPKQLLGDPQVLAMIPEEAMLGPAMKALIPRHQAFVMAVVNMGQRVVYSDAARMVGYQGNADTVKATAWRLRHDPRIAQAIVEEAKKRASSATLNALAILEGIMVNPKASTKERMKAAGMILDRGGLPAASEHSVNVVHKDDRETKIRRVMELATILGRDPKELLGSLSDVIDVDFKMLEDVRGK